MWVCVYAWVSLFLVGFPSKTYRTTLVNTKIHTNTKLAPPNLRQNLSADSDWIDFMIFGIRLQYYKSIIAYVVYKKFEAFPRKDSRIRYTIEVVLSSLLRPSPWNCHDINRSCECSCHQKGPHHFVLLKTSYKNSLVVFLVFGYISHGSTSMATVLGHWIRKICKPVSTFAW